VLRLALLITLALLSAHGAEAASEIAIHFKRGAYDARVMGELISIRDEVSYVVAAKAGQHMRIKIDAPGGVRGFITFPDGESQGAPGDIFFDGVLPKSGNYHILLRESPMGEEWQGRFTLTIEIH
jgi:hypothetical protein